MLALAVAIGCQNPSAPLLPVLGPGCTLIIDLVGTRGEPIHVNGYEPICDAPEFVTSWTYETQVYRVVWDVH